MSLGFDIVTIPSDAADPLVGRDTFDGSYMARLSLPTSTISQQTDTTQTIPPSLSSTVNTPSSCPASWHASATLQSCSDAFNCLAQNAATIGISPEMFLSADNASPFYQPFSTHDFLLTTIDDLPSSLLPAKAQMSYPHQAWIDCIPDPDLRSRIIYATCHKPPLLDCLDLWHDILAGEDPCSQDSSNFTNWRLSTQFVDRWQMLLKMDLQSLHMMCTASNPPLLPIDFCNDK